MELTRNDLIDALAYDPESGEFRWAKPRKKVIVGTVAGSTDKHGYRTIKLGQRVYFAHRLAWLYMHGQWPSGVIDHIDGNPANNRASNLRDCSKSQNQWNRKGPQTGNKTGFLGVSPQDGRFVATISAKGRQTYLGHFDTPDEASAAYQTAKAALHTF